MSRCPQDESPLATVEVLGRQLASCPRCHGLWVDLDELEALLRASGGPAPGVFEPDGGESVACPDCSRPLQTGAFPGNGLQAEVCPEDRRLWLAPGRLTRLLARRDAAPRPKPRARRRPRLRWQSAAALGLFFGVGWASMVALWPRLTEYVERQRQERLAHQAWQVRRGPELRREADGLDDPALRARQHFLAGEFSAAWPDLEAGDALREEVEKSLLFNVPWPRRVVRWLNEDLLVRVVDPGLGKLPRDLSLEVLAPSGTELDPEWKEPDGSPREAPAPYRAVTRLEEEKLTDSERDACVEGQTKDGLLMIALTTWEGRVVGYCFPTAKPVKIPKTGQIVRVNPDSGKSETWTWRQGRYVK